MTPSLLLSVGLLVLAISPVLTAAFTIGPYGKRLSVSSCNALKASKELSCSFDASHNENNANNSNRSSRKTNSDQDHDGSHVNQRRDLLRLGLTVTPMLLFQNPANAFANKISNKYDDRPKRRGPQPKDLGIKSRLDMAGESYDGLKQCGPAPNCFSSTDPEIDDPEHHIPAWTWPDGDDQAKAFAELDSVLQKYEPGQNNVDGGGFEIQQSKNGYIYVQYEALKGGYIDDVEFAVISDSPPNTVQVRSSSRVGYLDFGVNAKRLNYIAKQLRERGWNAEGVDFKTHQDYALQNSGR